MVLLVMLCVVITALLLGSDSWFFGSGRLTF